MSESQKPPGEAAEGTSDEVEVLDPAANTIEMIVASALTNYDPLVKEINELKESVEKTVFDLTKTKENKAARSLRAKLKAIPGALDKAYDGWNQPRLRAAEKMREKRDELKALVPDIVAPLDKQIELDDKRRADEKAEEDRKEAVRVGDIRKKIAAISALSVTMLTESSEKLGQVVDYLEQQEITKEVYEEFADEAKAVLAGAIISLKTIQAGALQREEQAKEIEELKAKAEKQAEADRIERERLAEEDRLAKERANASRLEAEEAAKKIRDEEEVEKAKTLAKATEVAESHQKMLQEQKDAFEDERLVANTVTLIQGAVAKAAVLIDVEKIEEILQGVRDTEVIGKTEDLRKQIVDAMNDSVIAIENLIARTKATNDLIDARAQASAQEKAQAKESARESAESATAPVAAPTPSESAADAPSDLEDALLDANAESAGSQLSPEELAMQTIQETGGTARPPASVGRSFGGGGYVRSTARPTAPPAEPEPELKAAVENVIAAKRPTDWIILDTLATSFGVKHAEVLDWLQDMDLFELAKKVETL